MGDENMLLDMPFSAEEVSAGALKLKFGKLPGPDVLQPHILQIFTDDFTIHNQLATS